MKTGLLDLNEYAIIRNLETCALVGFDGPVDWLCFPYLDSPSIFAALLGLGSGGDFRIAPSVKYTSARTYVDKTNILQTVFATAAGHLINAALYLANMKGKQYKGPKPRADRRNSLKTPKEKQWPLPWTRKP